MQLKTHALADALELESRPKCCAAEKPSGLKGSRLCHPEKGNDALTSPGTSGGISITGIGKTRLPFAVVGAQRDARRKLLGEWVPSRKQGKPGLCAGLRRNPAARAASSRQVEAFSGRERSGELAKAEQPRGRALSEVKGPSMARYQRDSWCPGRELNPHESFDSRDFKSRASASFATRADLIIRR